MTLNNIKSKAQTNGCYVFNYVKHDGLLEILGRTRQCRTWLPIVIVCLTSLTGCQQKMADQPSYKPLRPSEFFPDGRSERPQVSGTVARGYLKTDTALFTGRRSGKKGEPLGMATPVVVQPKPDSPEALKAQKEQYADFVNTFPFPMTKEIIEHGHDRFMIYCVVCHDPLGTGQGKIVERGYTAPPSYHIERLRNVPVGYLFAVMSEGYGSMPSYSTQIPVNDRWAIAGYIKALQLSQHYSKENLSNNSHNKSVVSGNGTMAGE